MRTPAPGAPGAAPLDPEQARMADAGLKAMVPVGRPFLDHVLHSLAEAGVTQVCIVTGPDHGLVREHYAAMRPTRLAIDFAVQHERRGTADAVAAAATFIGQEHVLVVNGDNLYPVDALRALCDYGRPALAAFSRAGLLRDGTIPPERLARFATVHERGGWLERIVEKPGSEAMRGAERDAPISMNCWLLPPAILGTIARLPLSPRGELELPLAVQAMVDGGTPFRVIAVDAPVVDLSQRTDIAAATARLRDKAVRL
jgi:glucose-1-phosphate thymidylyltransferase